MNVMPSLVTEQLRRWRAAGLIDAPTAEAILDYERARALPAPAPAPSRPDGRITFTEVVIYAAVAVGLVGLGIVLFATSITHLDRAAAVLAVAIAAAFVTIVLERRGDAAGDRGSGPAIALAIAACGTAATQFFEAAGWLVQTRTIVPAIYPPVPGFTETSASGAVAIGAAVTAVLAALVLLRRRAELVPAVVGAGAAYISVMAATDALGFGGVDPPHTSIAAIVAIAGLWLIVLSTLCLHRLTQDALEGAAAGITAVALYALGGAPDLELDVLGAVVAGLAMVVGTLRSRQGLAFAGAAGMAGLVIDIGARNVSDPAQLGLFLVAAAVIGLGLILAVSRLLRRGVAR